MSPPKSKGHTSPSDSYWPFLGGMAIAFTLAGFVYHWSAFIVGAAILIYVAMGWAWHSMGVPKTEGHLLTTDPKAHILGGTSVAKMGMWFFLTTEVMFFTALIGSGISLRTHSDEWATPGEFLNIPLTAANTFLLICSSMTMVEALRSARIGDMERMKRFLVITLLMGLTFVSVQGFEYHKLLGEGFTPDSSAYASAFYAQTAFHGGHVSAGVLAMATITVKAFRGRYSKDDHESIELMGLYWHFVDVVWIFLFTIVYLI